MHDDPVTPFVSHSSDPRLSEIISALLRIAQGDFSAPLVPSPRRDEIDAVMSGINYMAGELQSGYAELDRRVEERTRELAAARDAMRALASNDHLTGLANRLTLEGALGHRLEAFRRGGPAPCVISLDLDRFKSINDTWGHQTGDQVLRVIAGRLRSSVREGDLVARLGGDEFAVLLSGEVDESEAHDLCVRLCEAVNPPLGLEGVQVSPGASVGFAVAGLNDSAVALMHQADTAMYASKRAGVGRPQAFRPWMLDERRRTAGTAAGASAQDPEAPDPEAAGRVQA